MYELSSSQPTVGIVTYHKSLSYGGCLQAYATQVVLEGFGCRAFFVDYENPYEARKKTNAVFKYGTTKERIAAVAKRVLYRQAAFQRKAFESFHKDMPTSKRSYERIEQLRDFEVDTLLVASDQVWNPLITGGIDPVFFLDFGQARRKVSFASSVGSYTFNSRERAEIARYLEGFDAVSVRESFAREQLQTLIETDVRVVLDPTLQVASEKWREVASCPEGVFSEGYILVFMVSSSYQRYEKLLDRVRRHYDLPVIQVRLNAKRPPQVDCVVPATPFELVWLIDHAAFVLSDSFHGLAFSVNMETPFAALPNMKNNVRLQELIDTFGLVSRLFVNGDFDGLFDSVDFSKARLLLQERRGEEGVWLSQALRLGGGSCPA